MKRLLVFALIGAAAFLLGRSNAQAYPPEEFAWPTGPQYVVPVPDGLEELAENYWAARLIPLPPLARLYEVSAPAELGGHATYPARFGPEVGSPEAQVWLRRSEFRLRHEAAYELCESYLHERGHNAGLTHGMGAIYPVMEEELGAAAPIRVCVQFANRRA